MKKIIEKYRSVLSYLAFSVMCAGIETAIGLLVLNFLCSSALVSNIIATLIGSVVHYLCVTKKSFDANVSLSTFLVYAGTFVLGLIVQNIVVWLVNGMLIDLCGKNYAFILAKGFSLVISFFLLYGVRKMLYRMVERKE